MKQKLFVCCTVAALLLPLAANAQDETKKPAEASAQPDRQKLREELRNLSPEERSAKLREMREKGLLPQAGQGQGQGQRPFQAQGNFQPGLMPAGAGGGLASVARVLTPEQRESYNEANRAVQSQTRELEERIREARKTALEASVAAKLDEADLRKKLEAAAKFETELTILRAKTLAKMEPPLSEEQIQQVKSGPLSGNMPQRFQGQRQGQGPDSMQREPLPFGNQPLPPPGNAPGPREGNDMPRPQAP